MAGNRRWLHPRNLEVQDRNPRHTKNQHHTKNSRHSKNHNKVLPRTNIELFINNK